MSNSNGNLFGHFGRKRKLRQAICGERERLYRIAWSWCHDSHLADDLVQETLTRALSKLDSLREESRLRVWLTQILANFYRDQFRRVQPETGFDNDGLIAEDGDPEHAADRTLLITQTRQAIAMLNDDQRQVLTLVDVAEFSYADTAAILDVPVGTVMSRLSRARRRIREILEQQGIGRAEIVPLRRHQ